MKLMMLGETTGNKRSKDKYEFLGTNASRFIWIELAKYDLYREDFHTYSVFNDLGHKKKEMSDEEYLLTQIELNKELMMYEPDLVLSVGRYPTEELLQKKLGGRFFDICGELLFSTNYNIWFVPTIHPSVAARNEDRILTLQTSIVNFYEYYIDMKNK